jgi:hypothetical protein
MVLYYALGWGIEYLNLLYLTFVIVQNKENRIHLCGV